MEASTRETPGQVIRFTEVTLRDGEQQEKKQPNMNVEDRIAVCDHIVATGIDRIEIGHLGNPHDIRFTKALVSHIEAARKSGSERYNDVELQVLFGSQTNLVDEGVAALNGFDSDRVIIHVYDRASPNLRHLAEKPYSTRESAERVFEAAQQALERGFTRFSISGEGTVDPDLSVSEALSEFYVPLIEQLQAAGAREINVNMPNTFGSSLEGEWGRQGMSLFNMYLKERFPQITTSVHAHNDHNSAVEYSLAALEAGFDRVEGAITGMGERTGNTNLADVAVRLSESARTVAEAHERAERAERAGFIGTVISRSSIWDTRYLSEAIISRAEAWFDAAESIAAIYGTQNRFYRSSLGNPEAYNAGCGPHSQANKKFLEDPVKYPLWRNYGRIAIEHAIWGRPEAQKIIEANREFIKAITLETHAAGGSNEAVWSDTIPECNEDVRRQAAMNATILMHRIRTVMSGEQPGVGRGREAFALAG